MVLSLCRESHDRNDASTREICHRPRWQPLDDRGPAAGQYRRWVIRRKAEVVAAVRGGLLSLEEACERYTLTVEEFLSWQSSINDHGLAGLRTTRIQQYRH